MPFEITEHNDIGDVVATYVTSTAGEGQKRVDIVVSALIYINTRRGVAQAPHMEKAYARYRTPQVTNAMCVRNQGRKAASGRGY